GLGYEALSAGNPRLVYASCSGFGQDGPDAHRGAYDPIIQAVSGVMSITGAPDGPPARVGYSIGDLAASLFLATGISAALYERAASGKGQRLDISMLECQLALLENPISRYLATGEVPQRLGSRHPVVVPGGGYPTRDGAIVLSVQNASHWESLCRVVDRPEWLADPRFGTPDARRENRQALEADLSAVLRTDDTAAWLARLQAAGVVCGPINSIPQVLDEPQVRSRRVVQDTVDSQGRHLRVAGSPLRLSRTPPHLSAGAPLLGEHTGPILKTWLGLSQSELAHLREAGAFGSGHPGPG
ncbi:MAG: CaiB/BaiF CoA transferase family protein, partial [Chloroflexota bacterium]